MKSIQTKNRAKPNEAKNWLLAHVAHEGDECLIWPFGGNWNGYGHLKWGERIIKAHRVMCICAHGEPPTPKHVAAHSCKNGQQGCVNPRHLSWKTPSDNLMDRRRDGTLTKKRWTRYGRLSDADVAAICLLKPFANQREIGAMFGISYQHVSVIQQGKLKRQRQAV